MKIYRSNIELIDVEIDDKSVLKHSIMGDEVCDLDITIEQYYNFIIRDYIIYQGQKFQINTLPKVSKIANNEYQYNIRFEGIKYELGKSLFMLGDETDFFLNSDIEQILDNVITNINRTNSLNGWIGVTWTKGVCSITDFRDFQFTNQNCLQALTSVCLEFGVEFECEVGPTGYILNVRDSIGIYSGLSLQYKSGIFSLNAEPVNSENPTTVIYAYGAEKNIPDGYGHKRLKLPALSSANVNLYGNIEKSVIFDELFPSFTGSVIGSNTLSFLDTSIDFDLNSYLIPGVTAKVEFLSGDLAGYQFEIFSYNNTTQTVTLVELTNEVGEPLPNPSRPIAAGNRYTFTDIYMPTEYVTAAELKLQEKAIEYRDKNDTALVKYSIQIDARYLRKNNITLNVGEKIDLLDNDMTIDKQLRIYSISQSLANPYNYSIELTDELMVSKMIKLLFGQYDFNKRLDKLKNDLRILKNK